MRRLVLGAALLVVVAAFAAALATAPSVWSLPGGNHRVIVKLTLLWGSLALLPVAPWLAWQALVRWRAGAPLAALGASLVLAVVLVLLWARFVEPARLRVVETPIGDACGVRVALVSDLHRGLYGSAADIGRLVDRLNTLDLDAVLVAGDWTYEPQRDLGAAFAAWQRLRHRSIGVLGNHDEQAPGPPLQHALRAALAASGLEWADGRRVSLGRCELVGLGDLHAGSAGPQLRRLLAVPSGTVGQRRVVLAHDPDTVALLPRGFAALLLSGHTHGGQINLPLVTARVLAAHTAGNFARGLYQRPEAQVFVTSGIGMIGLPLRLFMPPTIDVLTL